MEVYQNNEIEVSKKVMTTKQKENKSKIGQIGGTLNQYFDILENIVQDMNKELFPLWKLLHSGDDIRTFVEAFYNGESVLLDRYVEAEFSKFVERYKKKDPEAIEIASRYKNSELRPHNTEMQIKKNIRKNLDEQRKGIPISYSHRKTRIMDYFEECLSLDPDEGIYIDADKFIQVFEEITKGRESEFHERHEAAVQALNDFFGRCPITWEEMQRYFLITSGRVKINTKEERISSYIRLQR